MDAAIATGFVGFPLAAIHYGASRIELGLLGAAPQIAFVASCLALGSLSDRLGRRRVMMAGALCYVLAFFLSYRGASVHGLILAALVVGAAGGLFWPALEGAIGDAWGHGPLGRGLLLFNFGWTTGMAVGAAAGGRLADRALSLPFLVALAVGLVTLPLIAVWRPVQVRHAEEEHAGGAVEVPKHAEHFLVLARIANFCCFFAIASMRALFPALGKSLAFDGRTIGLLIAATPLAQSVSFLLLSRSHRWQYRLLPLAAAQAAVILALIGMLVTQSDTHFALLFGIVGAGCGVTYTASLFYSLNRPADRGKMGALHEAILGGGSMAGPLMGGALAQAAGLRSPYLLAAIVMLLGLAYQVVRHRSRRMG